jgi:hypothetical protein
MIKEIIMNLKSQNQDPIQEEEKLKLKITVNIKSNS